MRQQLPSTANQPLSHIPRTDLEEARMRVAGRPQDFGAVIPQAFDGVDLPPDYHQATEPFPRI